jgi:hypothetical protein
MRFSARSTSLHLRDYADAIPSEREAKKRKEQLALKLYAG